MRSKSRRQAREAALRALYQLEVTRGNVQDAIQDTLDNAELSTEHGEFMQKLVLGVREHQAMLDKDLAALISDWDFDRVAPIDRNILRIAAFELYHIPSVPPAVSINEAIEMAKKYSTAESGKFVNGVLGKMLGQSPKANWDPATAPPEEETVEVDAVVEEAPVEVVREGTPEAEELAKIGLWRVRSEDQQS